MGCQQECAATIIGSEDPHFPRLLGASSSSQHSAASRIPTLSKLGELGTSLTKVMANRDFVVGTTGNNETCADMDRETVVSNLFDSVSRENRDRDQNVALNDMQNLNKILERKAELAMNGEKLAQQTLYESEAYAFKHWEN